MGPLGYVGKTIYIVQKAVIVVLHGSGMYLLWTDPHFKVMYMLLFNLSTAAIIYATFDFLFNIWLCFNQATYHSDLIRTTGWMILFPPQFFAYILLTCDRVLIVHLGLKYKPYVTKRRVFIVSVSFWILNIFHIIYYWYPSPEFSKWYFLIWDSLLIILFAASYSYIFISVRKQRSKVSTNSKKSLNYKVPFYIVLSMFFSWFIPDLLIQTEVVEMNIWLSIWWALNLMCDPLIYIVGIPSITYRLREYWCKVTANSQIEPDRRRRSFSVDRIIAKDRIMEETPSL